MLVSQAEAIVRSPTNMAVAKIAAVDFIFSLDQQNDVKMTSLYTGGLLEAIFVGGRSASQSTPSNASPVLDVRSLVNIKYVCETN